MAAVGPITQFTDAVEKALRNATTAHIKMDVLRAVVESPAYAMLLDQRRQELVSTWEEKGPKERKQRASRSETSGSNGGPSAANGASPGTIPQHVQDAAEALALEAVLQTIHPKQPARRSPPIISPPASPPSQSPRRRRSCRN